MARAPCTFRQSDVTRAVRAAFAGGAARVRVQVGEFIVTAEKGESLAQVEQPKDDGANEWDAVK